MQHIDNALVNYISYCLGLIREDELFKHHDIVAYYGSIDTNAIDHFDFTIRELVSAHNIKSEKDSNTELTKNRKLLIVLHTGGGIVEVVEKLVEITRHFYSNVDFLVPDNAMSAGTIWCMSGDNIYMNYSSSLGPIDPQVQSSNGAWIPALGYLDKFNELVEKSKEEQLSQAELILLSNLDLAEMQRYQQAANLSTDLLKKWLVTYKFKDWKTHRTDKTKMGSEVTDQDKKMRAEEIAKQLNDTSIWRSHGRYISMKTIKEELRLQIEDYSNNENLMNIVNTNHGIILEYMQKTGAVRSILRSSCYED